MKNLWFLAFGCLALSACSTDVQLNDKYTVTPVVYTVLDAQAPVQMVRFERSYLGTNNAYLDAKQVDSIYYDTTKTKVLLFEQPNGTGNWKQVDAMRSVVLNNKPGGTFANPAQLLYFSKTPLKATSNYKVQAILPDGKLAEGITTGVSAVTRNTLKPAINWSSIWQNSSTPYKYPFRFAAPKNAKIYDVYLRINYWERKGSVQDTLSLTWQIAKSRTFGSSDPSISVVARDLFQFMRDNLSTTGFTSRGYINCDLVVSGGSQTLKDYIEINAPSESLSDVHPNYTNIANGQGLVGFKNTGYLEYNAANGTMDTLKKLYPELGFTF